MAVRRLDAAASGLADDFTYNVSAALNSDRLLIVCIAQLHSGAANQVTVTYGNQTMIKSSLNISSGNGLESYIFYLADAGIAAADDAVVRVTGQNAVCTYHAISYQGVRQTTPIQGIASAGGTGATPNPVTTVDRAGTVEGALINIAATKGATTASWNAAMTEQTDIDDTTVTGSMADKLTTSTDNVDVECTWATQDSYATITACIHASVGILPQRMGPASTIPMFAAPAVVRNQSMANLRRAIGWGILNLPVDQPPISPQNYDYRRCGATLLPLFAAPGVIPGSDPPNIRKQSGWGYCNLPVSSEAPAVVAELVPFVYRRRMQRLRARKR